jgi:hypothetical protein
MAAQRTIKYCPVKDHPGYYYVEGMIDWHSYPVAALAARKEFFEVTDYRYVLATDILSSIVNTGLYIVKMEIIPFDWVEGFQNRITTFLGFNKPNKTHVGMEVFQRLSGLMAEEIKEIIEAAKVTAPKKTKPLVAQQPAANYAMNYIPEVIYIPDDVPPPTEPPPQAIRRG